MLLSIWTFEAFTFRKIAYVLLTKKRRLQFRSEIQLCFSFRVALGNLGSISLRILTYHMASFFENFFLINQLLLFIENT